MKVLMFGWEFPPMISGGLGTACFGITKGLSSLDVQVDFVLPKVEGHDTSSLPVNIIDASKVLVKQYFSSESSLLENINIIGIDSTIKPYMTEESYRDSIEILKKTDWEMHTKEGKFINFSGKYGNDLLEEVYRLREVGYELGKNTNAEILHAHDWMTFPLAIAAKESSRLPLVVHVHATEFDRSSSHINQQLYDIERGGMHAADMVIAVSHKTKHTIVDRYGVPEHKVTVVHNAIDTSEKLQDEVPEKVFREPVVLFLGRITSQKGPGYFLETARIVLAQNRNVRFVMAGAGDMLTEMVRLCATMRLQDRFHFTGFLRGKGLHEVFSLSDVLVMPSVSEPFGIVPVEAIQYDLPVIISKQSGVSEVLPHAIKVDFWDTELFAKAILDLLKNPKKKQKYIEDNRETLSNMNWSNAAGEILYVYEQVMAQND